MKDWYKVTRKGVRDPKRSADIRWKRIKDALVVESEELKKEKEKEAMERELAEVLRICEMMTL